MIKKWDAATTTRFVQEYAKHTCLWDVNNENYKSRAARDAAVEDIVCNMGMNDLHPNDVKCKIRIIRNTYINEMKKIREKKRLIGGRRVNYVCNIPWFKTADQFLRKVVRKKKFPTNLVSLDTDDNECDQYENEDFPVRESAHNLLSVTYNPSYSGQQIKEELRDDSENEELSGYSFQEEPPSLAFSNLEARSPCSYFSNRSPMTSSNVTDDSSVYQTSSDKRTYKDEVELETTLRCTDEFDIFAKNVGVQLKQLPLENALQLQAKIHDLLISERLRVIRQNKKNGLVIDNGDETEVDS